MPRGPHTIFKRPQYVSFVEIFGVKAVDAFKEAGTAAPAAVRYATFGFFGGAVLTWLLDKFADSLMDVGELLPRLRRRWQRRKSVASEVGVGAVTEAAAAAVACCLAKGAEQSLL